jgi:hypothetical protein
MKVLLESEAGLCPALLTAITRNWYSFPSIKPCTTAVGLGVVVSKAFSHNGLYLSFISTIYPVIGEPPSDGGSVHFNSTCWAVQSTGSGAPGLLGVANK